MLIPHATLCLDLLDVVTQLLRQLQPVPLLCCLEPRPERGSHGPLSASLTLALRQPILPEHQRRHISQQEIGKTHLIINPSTLHCVLYDAHLLHDEIREPGLQRLRDPDGGAW
jgi:hypothetical protein